MSSALKFYDNVLGVDVHLVMVPGSPTPVPLPHVFAGILVDPIGKALDAAFSWLLGSGGPVWINGVHCANTGTRAYAAPHLPTPPGVAFAPIDIPTNDGTVASGSETVWLAGSRAGRTGSNAMTCNFPVQLPTGLCLALPAGAPVEIGGPTGWDALAVVFAGIRTMWVSSRLHKLLRVPFGSRRSKLLCFLTGHPVDVASGAVSTEAQDFELPGPLPLRWERNYCSREASAGALGPGWSHSLEVELREVGRWAWLQLADGRRVRQAALAVGASAWEPSERYTLSRPREELYVVEDTCGLRFELGRRSEDGSVFSLVRVADRDGNEVRLEYAEGLLAEVHDSAGRRLQVEQRGGRVTAVRLWLPRGESAPLVEYEYDAAGMLVASRDPEGGTRRYAYRGGVLVRETDRRGLSFWFEYDWEHPEGWCVRTWGDGGIFARTLRYDKFARVTEVEDSRGGRTIYFANAAGLVDRIVDAGGGTWRYEWHPELLCPAAEEDPLGGRWTWEYDARGELVAACDPAGGQLRWRYEGGELVEAIDARGQRRRWERDARGRVTRAWERDGAEWAYGYDERGQLAAVRDPLGRVCRFEHDSTGAVRATSDRDGHATRYEYDAWGRPVRRIGALGGEQRASWDGCGRLRELVRADGSRLRLEYDLEGNLVRAIDAAGGAWSLEYGGYNAVKALVDPLGGRVEYGHDAEGELVEVVNQRGEVRRFERDACGRVTRAVGFDGRTQVFRHDLAGGCVGLTKGDGRRVSFARDQLGQVVTVRGSDGVWLEFERDACGDVVLGRNEAGEVRLERDACGRVTREHAGDAEVESEYDALGRRVRRSARHGGEVRWEYDGEGAVVRVRVPRGAEAGEGPPLGELDAWEVEVLRDAEGREVSRRWTGGFEVRTRRDALGRPTEVEVRRHPGGLMPDWSEQAALAPPAEVLERSRYSWEGGRLREIEDLEGGVTRFEHDLRGVLSAALRPDGAVERRVMDPFGDLYRTEDRSDRSYGPGGRVLEADGARFAYDADGNMVGRIAASGEVWRYTWDSLGRLVRVDRSEEGSTTLAYDAFGRRIERVGASGERLSFRWDLGDLAWESSGDGARGWVLGDDGLPLSSVGAAGFAGHHSGMAGEKFAGWEVGEVARGRLDLDGTLVEAEGPLDPWRWPGQYDDAPLGLHYNHFRYYAPELGAYTSQDPLQADLHPYRYVLDPLLMCDLLGLAWSPKMLEDALAVLRKHEGAIREAFGADVQVGIRGSLVDGIRFKTGTPFRPDFFDVDGFVVTSGGPQGFPKSIYRGEKLANVLKLEAKIKKELLELDGFSGMVKQGGFGFKVWRKVPSGAVTTGGTRTPRESLRRRPGAGCG